MARLSCPNPYKHLPNLKHRQAKLQDKIQNLKRQNPNLHPSFRSAQEGFNKEQSKRACRCAMSLFLYSKFEQQAQYAMKALEHDSCSESRGFCIAGIDFVEKQLEDSQSRVAFDSGVRLLKRKLHMSKYYYLLFTIYHLHWDPFRDPTGSHRTTCKLKLMKAENIARRFHGGNMARYIDCYV